MGTKGAKIRTGDSYHHRATTRHAENHSHRPPPSQPGRPGRNTKKKGGGRGDKPRPRRPPHSPSPQAAPRSSGGVRAERAHERTCPNTLARISGVQAKLKPGHTHHKPEPRLAGRSQSLYLNTHTLDPSQECRGYCETEKRTQAPHISRKPSVHSPGTEAANAMQVTRPNVTRTPGVRLHLKACAALGLEAERARPRHLPTPVPRTSMHALKTGYARSSGDPPEFRPK